MNDSEFHLIVDNHLAMIEETLDEAMVDFDYETMAGVLKLVFADGSQIIINRQEPLHEIWVATKFDGHHFALVDGQWIDNRGGDELLGFLSAAIERQSGVKLSFAL